MNRSQTRRGRLAPPGLLAGLVAVSLVLGGCDTDALLEVDEPTFATPESLDNPAGLPTLVAGGLGDFQIAYSGSGGDSYLSVASLITDELHASDTFTTRQATDQRDQFAAVSGNTSDAAYDRLQYARRSTAEVAAAVERNASTSDSRFVLMKALEGYAIVALAEGFCGAVPLGTASGGVPGELGTPLSTQQLFQEAITRFDAALAGISTSNVARVGRGRALLNNGQFQEAAAAVSGVPTTFVHFIEHSSNSGRQFNPIFSLQANGRYSMSDREGTTGLPYRTVQDPRLPWVEDARGGFDNTVRLFIDLRYNSFGSNVPLSTGVEARLIEAEAALRAGDVTAWLGILNALRADVATLMAGMVDGYATVVPGPNNPTTTLPPLTDPGTEAARVDLMFQERAFWLFTTGTRLGDMRRLIRQYNRGSETVFPTGQHHKGGTYGTDVNLPIPFNETQNPNYDVSMCNTSAA
jgi:starch-binding outer membrane protein, SusD/RagB family